MKMYLPFRDWSDDGHGYYQKVLIDAPSMDCVRNAKRRMEFEYGEQLWDGYANDCDNPFITNTIQKLLIRTNYPLEKFTEYQNDDRFNNFKDLNECFNSDFWNNEYCCHITLNTYIDTFIWLLNAHGARIKRLTNEDDIPMICKNKI